MTDVIEHHKLMTREEYSALKIAGWHSVCHDFRGEAGATAVRYGGPCIHCGAPHDKVAIGSAKELAHDPTRS